MITIQEIPQIRPPSISISLAQVSVSPDWQAVVCMKFLQWLLGHYAVWWKMGTVSWSASYINRTGKLFFFFLFYKVVEENSTVRAVEWPSVCFWVSAFSTDAHQTTAGTVTGVGGKPVNHAAANTLPFEKAVSHLRRCCDGTVVTGERASDGERERLGRRVGGRKMIWYAGRRRAATSCCWNRYCVAAGNIIELDA